MLYVHLVVFLVARILLQDDEVLQNVRVWNELFRRELGALGCAQADWC